MELLIGLFVLGIIGQLTPWLPEPKDKRGLIFDLFKNNNNEKD